jgi:hypothetical protein
MSNDRIESAAGRPPRPLVVDPAEFLALETIVMTLVLALAREEEREGEGAGQSWIHRIAEVAARAISKADIPSGDGRSVEQFRMEALARLGDLLGGISVRGDFGKSAADNATNLAEWAARWQRVK